MSNEEKYKLALFAVIRNLQIMPAGMRFGKTMAEINEMALTAMEGVLKRCNFEILKKQYNKAKEGSAHNKDNTESHLHQNHPLHHLKPHIHNYHR